jgi:two-component system OmpR family sensor kinase
MRSVERYLLSWVLGALAVGSVLLTLAIYLVTLDEINEVLDVDLKNVATALASYQKAEQASGLPNQDGTLPIDTPEDAEIVTTTWSPAGHRIYTSAPHEAVPRAEMPGLTRKKVGDREWILYAVDTVNGRAQASQRVSVRESMAAGSAIKVVPPMAMLVIVVGGLLSFALRKGLRPLDAAARSVAERSAKSLTPLSASDAPMELEPIVTSINGLIHRLSIAFAVQRRFLADAAHELRTPVTALRLQIQLLERAGSECQRLEALAELKAGIDRSQRLIGQFLEISSAEGDVDAESMEWVDLSDLARSVVTSMSPKAEQLGIDLGFSGAKSARIHGQAQAVGVLITNLVENTLRYTPAGGRVDVDLQVDGRAVVLKVVDNGPGIAESERERVFDRFYRGRNATALARDKGGSGLGLSIVRVIAEKHAAPIELRTPPGGQGLEVRVTFGPRAE